MAFYPDVILSTPGLVGYWRLNEASGDVIDQVGHAAGTNTGASYGVGSLVDNQPLDTSYDFNSAGDNVSIPDHADFGVTAMSIELWFNMDTWVQDASLAGRRTIGNVGGFSLDSGTSGNLLFWCYLTGWTSLSTSGWTAGITWHVVATFDGSDRRVYRNGVEVGTNALAGSLNNPLSSEFRFGKNIVAAATIDGRIDDVSYYNRALTATEIAGHYATGSTAPYQAVRTVAPCEVIIAHPGWSEQRIVPTSPPNAVWRTDGPGSFTCLMPTRLLSTYGLNVSGIHDPLKGPWIWWEHPTAGPWSGVITRTEVGSWYTRVTAEQYNVLLRKRRLSANYGPMSIAPGSLALMFLNSAERNGDSFLLTGWTAEESGQAVDIEPRGGDLCDEIIPQLTRFGYQWRIKATSMDERAFEFRTRLGEDKRATVMLSEGRTIAGFRMAGDLWTVANDIVGIPGDAPWRDARGYHLGDKKSMRELGRRYEATIAYSGVVSKSTLIPLIRQDLNRLKYPREIAEVQIVDEDMCFRDFREGDTITVMSQHANLRAPMDVDIRALNAATGVMTIAGKLYTEDAA